MRDNYCSRLIRQKVLRVRYLHIYLYYPSNPQIISEQQTVSKSLNFSELKNQKMQVMNEIQIFISLANFCSLIYVQLFFCNLKLVHSPPNFRIQNELLLNPLHCVRDSIHFEHDKIPLDTIPPGGTTTPQGGGIMEKIV